MKTIGKRIAAARKSKGWTQEELGEKVGLTATGISSIEAGKSHSQESIKKILAVFKDWASWIEIGEGNAPKGLIITMKHQQEDNPWKDLAIQEMANQIEFYKEIIRNLTAGTAQEKAKAKQNFLNAPSQAGARVVKMTTIEARRGAQA